MSQSHRWMTRVASTLALTLLMGLTPMMQSPAMAAECADLVLLGLRGSGENNFRNGAYPDGPQKWLGETVGQVAEKLVSEGGFRKVGDPSSTKPSVDWISVGIKNGIAFYPAMPVPDSKTLGTIDQFLAEVTAQNTLLTAPFLDFYAQSCPNTKFALVGYSQGAAIARMTFQDWVQDRKRLPKKQDRLNRLIAVVTIADPLLLPQDPRLKIDSRREWIEKEEACGIERVLIGVSTLKSGCLSPLGNLAIVTKTKTLLATAYAALAKQSQLLSAASFIEPKVSLAQLASTSKVPAIAVCYSGDIVCSPMGVTRKGPIFTPKYIFSADIHSNMYKDPKTGVRPEGVTTSVTGEIAKWIAGNYSARVRR